MTTIADLVNEIERDHLLSFSRPEYVQVETAVNSAAVAINLVGTDALLKQAVLNTNFELLYVTQYNRNSRTATVIRGHLGSTASAIAQGQVVRVNPRFSDVAVMDAILDELSSWDERVFRVVSETLSFGVHDTSIVATPGATPYRVLEARRRPRWDLDSWRMPNVELRRSEAVSEFATGYSISLSESFGEASSVDVLYAVPFETADVDHESDLIADVGLDREMLEVLKWGALYRLMAGRETTRLDQTVHHRSDMQEAVPPGSNLQVAERYKALRDLRYNEAAKRLLARWPYTFAG